MPNTKQLGNQYEQKAADYLEEHGYELVERNFRCRQGEIDLVAMEDGYLCFIEVKYRKTKRLGSAAEAVTPAKQRRISETALVYLAMRGRYGQPVRFDVVAIDGAEIRLIKNAFEYGGTQS